MLKCPWWKLLPACRTSHFFTSTMTKHLLHAWDANIWPTGFSARKPFELFLFAKHYWTVRDVLSMFNIIKRISNYIATILYYFVTFRLTVTVTETHRLIFTASLTVLWVFFSPNMIWASLLFSFMYMTTTCFVPVHHALPWSIERIRSLFLSQTLTIYSMGCCYIKFFRRKTERPKPVSFCWQLHHAIAWYYNVSVMRNGYPFYTHNWFVLFIIVSLWLYDCMMICPSIKYINYHSRIQYFSCHLIILLLCVGLVRRTLYLNLNKLNNRYNIDIVNMYYQNVQTNRTAHIIWVRNLILHETLLT